MRNYRLFFALATATILFGGILLTNSCSKQDNSMNGVDEQLLAESQAMTEKVLAFKQRMEYYRDNPGLKDGGSLYTAPDAMLELETLLNYTFCHTGINCPIVETGYSEVVMPLNELNKIADPRLSQLYYEEIIDSIQAQMNRSSLENKKLLLVDLEQTGQAPNGDAIIGVTALFGIEPGDPVLAPNWWYGEHYGQCDGSNFGHDAATVIRQEVYNMMYQAAPAGCRWRFSSPVDKHTFDNPLLFPLEGPMDNYRDYKIYYAESTVVPYTDAIKCLTPSDQTFYRNHYITFVQDIMNVTNKKFYNIEIAGIKQGGIESPEELLHKLDIYVGNRYLECDPVPVDDILIY
jgi:hypothetical protein